MDYRAKDGEMRRVHRETVDVLARFGRDGRLEPCVVVLKDCRAFRIDEVLMASACGAGARSVWRCVGWQDLRVVRDLKGPCSEKGPFLARSSRYAFPKGDLRGYLDTWRAYLAIASSFRIHGGDMLP